MKRGMRVGYLIVAVLVIIFLGIVIYNSGKEKSVMLGPESGGDVYSQFYDVQQIRDENGMMKLNIGALQLIR